MRLSTWIAESGGRPAAARLLDVTPEAIHYWLSGKSTPNFRTIFRIVELSKGRVTPASIFAETKLRERCEAARRARKAGLA